MENCELLLVPFGAGLMGGFPLLAHLIVRHDGVINTNGGGVRWIRDLLLCLHLLLLWRHEVVHHDLVCDHVLSIERAHLFASCLLWFLS